MINTVETNQIDYFHPAREGSYFKQSLRNNNPFQTVIISSEKYFPAFFPFL